MVRALVGRYPSGKAFRLYLSSTDQEWHHPGESLRAAPKCASLQPLSKRISLQS
ncbi:hypothetical protein VCRA2119O430_150124 [Vibrio crassostreae]|nr:hypothetical protein VCRA2113O414_100018 [Vibrio crassostreae]CAK1693563.1 hypothetical protein VCRA2113O418_100018 [Vibrio crassostreae]CAK1709217.1 hypothetical protein VCRA2118O429_100162 [Vibrio crassostreae]CAK1710934.1 hypothetical protein VCRA2119O432_110018 [Vibrio crassostreae]CAK1725871.1 hypothetical protein VCRA2114O423_110163 [Vibrio crassostreae]